MFNFTGNDGLISLSMCSSAPRFPKEMMYKNSENNVMMGAGAVVNGELVYIWGPLVADVSEWTTYTADISGLPYVDYIILSCADGAPEYKDIILYKS